MANCCDDNPLFQEAQRRGVSHECFDAGPRNACAQCCATILAILTEQDPLFDLVRQDIDTTRSR